MLTIYVPLGAPVGTLSAVFYALPNADFAPHSISTPDFHVLVDPCE